MRSFKLSRRAMLAGLGAGVALPVLDAMVDSRGLLHGTAHAQARSSPVRLVTFFFPNGVHVESWVPTTTGPGYATPPSLRPLEAHRANFTVVSGVNLGITTGRGDPHGKGTCCFATAAPLTATACTGPSVDQVAHDELGAGTRSLVLGLQDKECCFTSGGVTNVGDIYSEISWSRSRGGVVESVREPAAVFDALFGGGPVLDARAARARRYEQSVLSYVRESTARLARQLGAADRLRLDAHLTAIRELEARIAATSAVCRAPDAPARGAPPTADEGYTPERARQQMDLLALAMACDLTRYGSFMLGNGSTYRGCGGRAITGAALPEHAAAHSDSGPTARYDVIRVYKRHQMEQVGYFLDRLAAITEPGGTLLDNAVVYIGSELSDPVSHSNDNLPILLAGRAGGRLRPGSHVRFDGAPLGNLLLTLLRAVGSTAGSIGNSTGVLPGLLA